MDKKRATEINDQIKDLNRKTIELSWRHSNNRILKRLLNEPTNRHNK